MSHRIGMIVENASDEAVLLEILTKLARRRFGTKSWYSKGCGNLKAKCIPYARDLKTKGCHSLLVVQDLDENEVRALRNDLFTLIEGAPFRLKAIVIPVREIEAWLLADEDGLTAAFRSPTNVRATRSPESERDAKGRLRSLLLRATNRRVEYVNTLHNARIARHISPTKIAQKCPSFIPLMTFIDTVVG